jgi:hypothetical protein
MKRLVLFSIFILSNFLFWSCAANKVAPKNSVAGTTWAGVDSDGDYYEYNFMPDGKMYFMTGDEFDTNGSWVQTGDSIYMETYDRFAERVGHIDGLLMKGFAWNVQDHKWTWEASRLSEFKAASFLAVQAKGQNTKKQQAEALEGNIPQLAGTAWSGVDSDNEFYEYYFIPGGDLHYDSPNGYYRNGSWVQIGDSIYMETNNRYSERMGTVYEDSIAGNAKNVKGHTWTWRAILRTDLKPKMLDGREESLYGQNNTSEAEGNAGVIGLLHSGAGADSTAPTTPWNEEGDTLGVDYTGGGLGLSGFGEGGFGGLEGIGQGSAGKEKNAVKQSNKIGD